MKQGTNSFCSFNLFCYKTGDIKKKEKKRKKKIGPALRPLAND